MKNDQNEKKWVELFEELKNEIQKLLLPGERMVQCLDHESFSGRYYIPYWVSTSRGRIYSLACKRFLVINMCDCGKKDRNGNYTGIRYYRIGGKMLAHRLTANYFCDKRIVEIFGEQNVEVHHKKAFDETKNLMDNNAAENLCYVPKAIHRDVFKKIYNGKLPAGFDSSLMWVVKNFAWHDGKSLLCTVSSTGKIVIQFEIVFESKFFSEKEIEQINRHGELDRYAGLVNVRKAVRNMDGTVNVIYADRREYCYSEKGYYEVEA